MSKAATVLLGEKALFSKYSAVQVRIGGAKGMLATWPQTKGNQVILRDSMLKYESKHQKFGAVMVRCGPPYFLFSSREDALTDLPAAAVDGWICTGAPQPTGDPADGCVGNEQGLSFPTSSRVVCWLISHCLLSVRQDALLAAFSKQLAEVEGLQERAASDKRLLEFDTTSVRLPVEEKRAGS